MKFHSTPLIVLLLLILSCSTNGEEKKLIEDIDQVLSDLPDPSAVPYTLQEVGAPFVDSLINPLEKLATYQNNPDKLAANMGIYAADVNYLAHYKKEDDAIAYINACHQIGVLLGDEEVFKEGLKERMHTHINNQDSLAALLREMIVTTSIQLEKDHHLSMAALALTGTFIEELFQAVNVIHYYHGEGSDEDSQAKLGPLVELVLNQEKPLLDLIKLLEDLPDDEFIWELKTELNILDILFKDDLQAIREKMDSDPDHELQPGDMEEITLEIERIRHKLVN